MVLIIPDRIQRAIAIGLGCYFAVASLSDLAPAIGPLPGFAPPGCPRVLQVAIGCLVALGAVGLLAPRLSKFGAWLLVVLWLLRTVWNMTGGQSATLAWFLPFPLLLLVGRRDHGGEAGAGPPDSEATR
jgi:hypothetical protein